MKTSDCYKPTLSFGLLLMGPPKTGKTGIALQFPGVYIADCDNNLSGALRHLKEKGQYKPFKYDTIPLDDKDGSVPPDKQWERLVTCCKAAAMDPDVRTIVIDSASTMCDMLCNHIVSNKDAKDDKTRMTISDWVPFRTMLTKFIQTFRSVNKYFIMTCHEMVEKDEALGNLIYKPAIPSKLQDNFGGFFSDVWLTKAEERAGKLFYLVRFVPEARRSQIGNSLGLPLTDTEFTWSGLSKKIDEAAKLIASTPPTKP